MSKATIRRPSVRPSVCPVLFWHECIATMRSAYVLTPLSEGRYIRICLYKNYCASWLCKITEVATRETIRCSAFASSATVAPSALSARPLLRPCHAYSCVIHGALTSYCHDVYTQGEMTSQHLWSRYVRHFVGITWHIMCGVNWRFIGYSNKS